MDLIQGGRKVAFFLGIKRKNLVIILPKDCVGLMNPRAGPKAHGSDSPTVAHPAFPKSSEVLIRRGNSGELPSKALQKFGHNGTDQTQDD